MNQNETTEPIGTGIIGSPFQAIRAWIVREETAAWIITLNCLTVFIMLFPEVSAEGRFFLGLIDLGCNIYFMLEAAGKISIDAKRYFRNPSDIFDFSLVAFVVGGFILGEYESASAAYLLRTVRLMKFGRLVKRIKGMKALLFNVKQAFSASVSICLMMSMTILILAMLMTVFYGASTPEYFGNPAKSIYTVIRLFTLEGWYEIPDALAATQGFMTGFVTKAVFSLIVIFGGVFAISFITSSVTDRLAQDEHTEILDQFNALNAKIDELTRKLEEKGK